MAHNTWRLIPLTEGTGAEQMAIDSWLLDQHVQGVQPPSLRFYTWRKPTISLGYHQRQFPDHWNEMRWRDEPVDLVRRPTGGRAVLHQGDLTYALIISGLKGSRRDVYRQLCRFLIEGWSRLGVALSFGEAGRGYIHNPNCFGTATAADLVMADGYKLIGSAQVYRSGCVLQHGSIQLRPDAALFEQVFGEKVLPPELPESVRSPANLENITAALTTAATGCLNAKFEAQALTPADIEAAVTSHQIELQKPLV